MSEKDIVRMSEKEVRRRVAAGEDRTDYERLRSLTDEEIEQAVREDSDAPPLLDEEWFERAEFVPGLGKETGEERASGGAFGELRAVIERLEKREQAAEAQGMQELANDLFDDRARLAGAVERLSREQGNAAGAASP